MLDIAASATTLVDRLKAAAASRRSILDRMTTMLRCVDEADAQLGAAEAAGCFSLRPAPHRVLNVGIQDSRVLILKTTDPSVSAGSAQAPAAADLPATAAAPASATNTSPSPPPLI